MNWLKKHVDSVAVITAIALAVYWMNHQLYGLEKNINSRLVSLEKDIDSRFVSLEKDMAVIKAVLIMNRIMPAELTIQEKGD